MCGLCVRLVIVSWSGGRIAARSKLTCEDVLQYAPAVVPYRVVLRVLCQELRAELKRGIGVVLRFDLAKCQLSKVLRLYCMYAYSFGEISLQRFVLLDLLPLLLTSLLALVCGRGARDAGHTVLVSDVNLISFTSPSFRCHLHLPSPGSVSSVSRDS